MKDDDLLQNIARANVTGKMSSEEMGAALEVLAGAPILRSTEKNPLNSREIYMAQDAEGNPLVAGRNYLLRGKKVKVLREQFGSGNFLDTYYRVWYLDENLEEKFVVVDAKYPKGPLNGGAVYRSKFEPIAEK